MTDAKRFIEQALEPKEPLSTLPWNHMRFSLQGLLLFMTLLAIASAVAFSFPPAVAAVICIMLQPCLVAAFISGALTAKDDVRVFCIGALVPVAQSIVAGVAGGGNWGYMFALMNSRQTLRGWNSAADQSVVEYLGQLSVVLGRIGRPMMINLLAFCMIALCSGYVAVWVRRFIQKRSTPPEPEASRDKESNQLEVKQLFD